MPDLDQLPDRLRQLLVNRPVQVNEACPVTMPRVPLSSARVAVVTTAGLHLSTDRPFEREDPSYRVIPSDARPADVLQSHTSIGFDRTAAQRDLDVVFPLELLRTFAGSGLIGELAPRLFSFMGAQPDPEWAMPKTGEQVAARLRADEVDIVVLTPT